MQRIAATTTSKLLMSNRWYATCPHAATVTNEAESSVHTATAATAAAATAVQQNTSINGQRIIDVTASFDNVTEAAPRPYSEVPGPKPLPLLGNTWRYVGFLIC